MSLALLSVGISHLPYCVWSEHCAFVKGCGYRRYSNYLWRGTAESRGTLWGPSWVAAQLAQPSLPLSVLSQRRTPSLFFHFCIDVRTTNLCVYIKTTALSVIYFLNLAIIFLKTYSAKFPKVIDSWIPFQGMFLPFNSSPHACMC